MFLLNYLRRRLRSAIIRLKFLQKPSIAYCASNDLLPSVMVRVPSKKLRNILALPQLQNVTQLNQDVFALLMNGFKTGYFVEIGANDGFTLSNTIYLEKCFGWAGILIEANPKYKESLDSRKRSTAVIKAVSSYTGKINFTDAGLHGGISTLLDGTHLKYTDKARQIFVACEPLDGILKRCNAPNDINFVSVDVEGAETNIAEQICNSSFRFKCGCIEHNYSVSKYQKLTEMFESANYRIMWQGQTRHDLFFVDCKSLPPK